jgi:hypothetical protein
MPESPEERRRFQRIATDKAVTLHLGDARLVGVVHDISLRGLLCQAIGELPPGLVSGAPVHARVQLDREACAIELDGEVAHIAGRQLGIHCHSMDVEDAARLRRLVELNLADTTLLERELSQLLSA